MARSRHPRQPLVVDPSGVVRFKKNAIVSFLLDNGGFDMNALARMKFPAEDRAQFAQLIGYSVSGWGDLSSYVNEEDVSEADRAADKLMTGGQRREKP